MSHQIQSNVKLMSTQASNLKKFFKQVNLLVIEKLKVISKKTSNHKMVQETLIQFMGTIGFQL